MHAASSSRSIKWPHPTSSGPALDVAKNFGAQALNVLATPLLFARRRLIFERIATLQPPALYEWPFNLKTAKALGLTIPPSLLLGVDQVIE